MLFLDLKGDIDTIDKFTNYAREADRLQDLMTFSLSDQTSSTPYNLIENGTPTQLRDKIMLSLNWSEEFYKNQSGSFLLKLLIGLCWLRDNQNIKVTLSTVLSSTINPEFLASLNQMIPETQSKVKTTFEECYHFLTSNENYKSLQGLLSQLESLILCKRSINLVCQVLI